MIFINTLNSEFKYKALVDAIGFLNSSMKVDEILEALLIKSVELLTNADTGLIFIYNKERDILEVKSAYGFDSNAYNILIRPGESITGQAFIKEKTITANGVSCIQNYMSDISFYKNLGKSADDFLGKPISGIKCAIASPIKIENNCIGVLVVDNFTNEVDFTDKDAEILEAISVQAALAIKNAQIMEKTENNRKELESYSKIVEAERNKYKYTIKLHNQFTNMILNGASFSALLSEVSNLLSSSIIFFDKYKNIVSASSFEDNIIPFEELKSEIIFENFSLVKINYVKWENESIRIQPVIIENVNNGWVVFIRETQEYSTEEEIIIDRGISVLALEIVKQQQLQSVDEKYRENFIDLLIMNQDEDMIRRYSNQFSMDFSEPYRLLLIEFWRKKDTVKSKTIERVLSYNYQLIPRLINKDVPFFITNKLNTIILILSEKSLGRKSIEDLFKSIDECNQNQLKLDSKEVRITAIASEKLTGYKTFGTSYFKVSRVLQQLKQLENYFYFSFYEDLKIKQLLLNSEESQLQDFMNSVIGPLIEDKRNSQELLRTLKAYIQSNDNWSDSKEKLYIHGNTLTQRLKRIGSILDLNLNNYYDHLSIQIALEIYDLFF